MAIPGKSDHDAGGMLITVCGFPSELSTLRGRILAEISRITAMYPPGGVHQKARNCDEEDSVSR